MKAQLHPGLRVDRDGTLFIEPGTGWCDDCGRYRVINAGTGLCASCTNSLKADAQDITNRIMAALREPAPICDDAQCPVCRGQH